MKASKQARREAKALFRSCQVDGLVDEARARQAVDQILNARPRGFLAILGCFHRLLKLDSERRLARIESAVPLSGEMEAALRSRLEQQYGRGLQFRLSQNPALIGGVRIQVGSDVYDGSIRARLNEMREAFESA
jgi:F-type H+-transporting ATPase subunit delta